jgi:hypothetical protein
MISTLDNLKTLDLKKYKRDALRPRRTSSAGAISRKGKPQPQQTTGSRKGTQNTLDMYGYVKRIVGDKQ